jgi:5'-methylthioadenosine phosphorylase
MVTDYDCWRAGVVSVPDMLAMMASNIEKVQRVITRVLADIPREHSPCPIGSDRALDHALVTAAHARDPALVAKLDAVAGRVVRAP